MSNRWPGGVIRKTPVTPAGPLQNGAASGVWSLADAAYWTKQGLWPLAGNTLAVEDVFSTWLYTGNGGAQTINNGIDLTGKGGLVWLKMRSPGSGWSSTQSHALFDTVRGDDKYLSSDLTNGQYTFPNNGITFNSSGFGIDAASYFGGSGDQSTSNFASWTFRKAPKFFDVVTYTGTGSATPVAHNLGVPPGFIVIKRTDSTSNWCAWHRNAGGTNAALTGFSLNTTAASAGTSGAQQTATTFNPGQVFDENFVPCTTNGATYVAYLFAHDPTADGVIQCGSFTTDGSGNATVDLGWEPQWLLAKNATGVSGWTMSDDMRGFPVGAGRKFLAANLSNAEGTDGAQYISPTSTGFANTNGAWAANSTVVYIAIRRGPMRTPTLGTSVFAPVAQTGGGTVTTNFPVDLAIYGTRSGGTNNHQVTDRLRGADAWVTTNLTNAETQPLGAGVALLGINNSNVGYKDNVIGAAAVAYWNFRRATGFMDVVCYTGTGVVRTVTHNLGVVPTLTIIKRRNTTADWRVTTDFTGFQYLNDPAAFTPNEEFWGYGTPTSTTIPLGINSSINASGGTYVAYLFASAPGVSKVGSYTGNGSSQTINCAFTTGSRFVMIKRTDSTGDWFVWDSARGIVAGNDPYLALNDTNAEVTTNDSVDTDNTGFIVNQVAASNVNVNGATYLFLAIA